MNYSLEDGKTFVKAAREVIRTYLEAGKLVIPNVLEKYKERRGVFVTLRKNGELRGCIGIPRPIYPLYEGLPRSAIAAATEDPRFPPLRKDELKEITIEVNVLTEPELIKVKDPLEYLDKIEIGKDGLIVEYGLYSGLLLPEVPVEENWDKATFLSYTCLKAGLPPNAWLELPIKVYRFQSQIFREVDPNGEVIEVKLRKGKGD
jgi:uncharacterized protein (TIGR00296 family)